jgi:hypothetical protein
MKWSIILCASLAVVGASSGQVLTPSSPALTPSSPFVPSSPVLASNTQLSTNIPVTTVLTVAEVAATLTNLQVAIEQSLPVLAAFNDTFDFTSTVFQPQPSVAAAASPGIVVSGVLVTNALARDTVRATLILQNDMERMLPLLNALNGGTNAIAVVSNSFVGLVMTNSVTPGNLTNVFGP